MKQQSNETCPLLDDTFPVDQDRVKHSANLCEKDRIGGPKTSKPCERPHDHMDGDKWLSAEALGSPEDMLKDPFLDTRASDFVTDPARGPSRFAGVADEPYGSGCHLLLPMLRRMQHGALRCARRLACCMCCTAHAMGHERLLTVMTLETVIKPQT